MSILSTLATTASAGSAIYAYDRENGEFDPDKSKKVGKTSLATGATTIIGQISDRMTEERIHREYASAYVDSMSDEDIEKALIALGQLECDESVKEQGKLYK